MHVVSGSLQGLLGAGRHHGRDQLEAEARGWSPCSRKCWAAELGPRQQSDESRSATTHHEVLPIAPLPPMPSASHPPPPWSSPSGWKFPSPKKTLLQEISNTIYFLQKVNDLTNGILLAVITYLAAPPLHKAPPTPQTAVAFYLHVL